MPLEWRAVDVEGLSPWRPECELAVRDAVDLIAAGEDGSVMSRIATTPMHADAATREARARARELHPNGRAHGETRHPRHPRSGRGGLHVLH
jgi:hypothetical protein